jgi:hypothetical protein
LDCDRGTIFSKRGENLVVLAQGDQNEIPVGFSVPIGTGIVGSVAELGQPVNIPDVYEDSRFNKDMDM